MGKPTIYLLRGDGGRVAQVVVTTDGDFGLVDSELVEALRSMTTGDAAPVMQLGVLDTFDVVVV